MASSSSSSPNTLQDLPMSNRPSSPAPPVPTLCGLPLKYVSLVTLAVQNAVLTIIMHYSRVSTPPEKAYSAAVAVLLNELLKGSISCVVALYRVDPARLTDYRPLNGYPGGSSMHLWHLRVRRLGRDILSPDCWKLSIPAVLYVVQNNLQYVAASNLDIATFQVTYQMKILTTAAFSVLLLRRRLTTAKWLSLLGLAIGVGVVQIQAGMHKPTSGATNGHTMHPMSGFLAVSAACLTSGLAGVYFEMVLKGSQTDLWVRNVQLSLFSLVPALFPIIFDQTPSSSLSDWFSRLFQNFGFWAWATVAIQVFGGLVTAIVIKYSDNILKGFATSLSIIISFVASVFLLRFGCSIVLASTWLYNQPSPKDGAARQHAPFPGSPVADDDPIIAGYSNANRASLAPVPRTTAGTFGLTSQDDGRDKDIPLLNLNGNTGAYANHPLPHSGAHTPASGLQSRDSFVDVAVLR
ncbi:nucleotide-sugar transporter-domain-containing protein [Auriculariales sp. MPI-PUGE-AT-0066]|nr:nucleotide-sugar transporter-domain-containing protein [Auriculariales sp. MPI-PUGE-AT-0066]